jgi:chromosome segregation ATPase
MLKKIIEMLISGQKELKTQIESVENTITNMPQVIASSTHKSSGYIHPSEDSDLFESDDYDDIMNKVIKRIAKIKKRLTHLEEHNQLNENKFFDVQIDLKQQQNEMERCKKDIHDIINKQSELDNNESVMMLVKERTFGS